MASDPTSDTSLDLLDMCFSSDDGLRGGMKYFPKCHGVECMQNLIIDHEGPSLPINPSSISRLRIERGEYPAVAISFKYLSSVVNDYVNWVNHELSDPETRQSLDKAGILSALLLSGLCNVNKDLVLLRHIVRRWSRETHTFVCLWGEFTPTLEDVANIMGLPIVGTLDPSKIQVSMEDVDKLCILKNAKDCFAPWVKYFWGCKEDGGNETFKKGPGNDSGCRLEALLSLWLSKFVFSDGKDIIQERVFPLALLISKGEMFPLAPMFLGYLYQSLDSIVTHEEESVGCKAIDSCVSTTFLQMFIWERLKDSSIKPTTLSAFKKKKLIGFSLECLPLMYRWFKKITPRDASSLLNCLDDEEKFKFRPYADLMEELPLKSMYDECGDRSGVVVLPVKNHGNSVLLDAYLIMKCGALPTFSDKVKSTLGEKTKISLVSYFPHRVRRQFGLDQGIPQEQSNDGCNSIQLFSRKLEVLDESTFVTLSGRERTGYKSKAFHDYWIEVLHGFKNYVECGGLDSRIQLSKSNDCVAFPTKDDLEVGGNNSEGRKGLVMEEEDCGTKYLIGDMGSSKYKKRKIRPKVLEKVFTKERVEDLEQGREKAAAIGSSISTVPNKRILRPRQPPKLIPSSDYDEEDSFHKEAEPGQSGQENSHKGKNVQVEMSPDYSADSSEEEMERDDSEHVVDGFTQSPLEPSVLEQGGKEPLLQRQQTTFSLAFASSANTRMEGGLGIGSSSSGIPKAPLFIAPTFPANKIGEVSPQMEGRLGIGSSFSGVPKAPLFIAPTFPAKKLEEVPPQIKGFVYWGAHFEGTERVLDSIEKLHPVTYSEDNVFPFLDMHVCPEVIAPLTKFFEKYGDMSQIDRFKYCMSDTKSSMFEKLGFVLLRMEKTSALHLTLDEILAWRDVVRDLICLGVPIGFLLNHLQKLVPVCYLLKCDLSQNIIEQMGEIRLLENSAEDIYKKIRVAQTKLNDLLSHDPNFPTEYSEFVLESSSGIGCSALLGLYDCRP